MKRNATLQHLFKLLNPKYIGQVVASLLKRKIDFFVSLSFNLFNSYISYSCGGRMVDICLSI